MLRPLILALAFQSSGLPPAPLSVPPGPPVSAIASAQRLFAAGRLDAAEVAARDAVAAQPQSADAQYLLAEILMRRNHPVESLRTLTSAAALRKPSAAQLRIAALDYILLEDTADAIYWLTRAIALSPNDAELWYNLGRAQYTQGGHAAAETSFRHALALDPTFVKAQDNLGLALAAQSNDEDALAAYTAAIALQSTSRTASEQPLLNRGELLLHLGRSSDALPDLTRAVEISPRCAVCHEDRGEALLALNRLAEAQAEMEQAVALESSTARFHYELSRLYKRLGDKERSAEELARSRQFYGSHSTPTQDTFPAPH